MKSKRLPGVYFETVVPPVVDQLPRMDIAAFVGFAESGPLNVPVAVEDPLRFTEIFGQDQALAWDTKRGEIAYAQLPPAVRAFFRNGGTRCWVLRVADDIAATANQFLVPGLLQYGVDAQYQGAYLAARSEGSWSDDFSVNATLSYVSLNADPPEVKSPPSDGAVFSVTLHGATGTALVPGDLLLLTVGDPAAMLCYLPVLSITTDASAAEAVTIADVGLGYWFAPASTGDFPQPITSPPPSPETRVFPVVPPNSVEWMTPPQNVELTILGCEITPQEDGLFQIGLDGLRPQIETITAGSWLRLNFNGTTAPQGSTQLLLLVDFVHGSTAVSSSSPPADAQLESMQVVGSQAWWALDPKQAWATNPSFISTDVVKMELWVRDGRGTITTLDNLGFSPQHPLYLSYLPSDAQLFVQPTNQTPPPGAQLFENVDHPRFALAAPSQPDALPGSYPNDPSILPLYLPLGVTGLVDADYYQPAIAQTSDALTRDGLRLPLDPITGQGQFTAGLFIDPDLANSSVNTVLEEAFHKQYQLQRGDASAPGEPLLKVHALLPLQEISLIAVPDAIHPGWRPGPPPENELLVAPTLQSISGRDASGQATAFWSAVDGATAYALQQSADPLFATWTVAWQGAGNLLSGATVASDEFATPTGCPGVWYYRVHATQDAIVSPWSNTRNEIVPQQDFASCASSTIDAPVLITITSSRGRLVLQWSVPVALIDHYVLQMAYEPAFALPQQIYTGSDPYFEVWHDPDRTSYFRVSANSDGQSSPWSGTKTVSSDGGSSRYEMQQTNLKLDPAHNPLLQVHQSMLRICAARGDIFAVLGLPRAYDTGTTLLYRSQLAAAMFPEDGDRTLSFGGIYHSWLFVLDAAAGETVEAVRSVTPEGTICGTFAARTLDQGAWVSPANKVLKGVVNLDPHFSDDAALTFFNNQLNLVVQESEGFLSISSLTLSGEIDLVEINVRRLIILLRRLALREGTKDVFESNDIPFRRSVQRRFEDLLNNLFLRGAFAGAKADDSFLVRIDSSVNTPQTIAQGLFIVELSIAPSVPLEFLTVRLVQTGGDLQLAEQF
jgi:hypothetical protein